MIVSKYGKISFDGEATIIKAEMVTLIKAFIEELEKLTAKLFPGIGRD